MSIFTAPSGTSRLGASDTSGEGELILVSASTGLPLNMTKGSMMICIVTSSDPTESTDPTIVMQDDVLNTWQYGGKGENAKGLTQYLYYCLSNVTTAHNTVYVFGNQHEDFFGAYLVVIPITGGYATFDTFAVGGNTTGTTATTATYN